MIFNLFQKPKIQVRAGKLTPTVLIILDGWGIAPPSAGNAITQANIPNFNKYMSSYPHGQLLASGESVGLPANEVGNTEVGHLNMGAGRLILQDLKKIDKAIQDGSFFENRSFFRLIKHAQDSHSRLHIMGLVSSGKVHSSINHLNALLEFCKKTNLPDQIGAKNIFLHLFTDGRDAPPQEGMEIVGKIEETLKNVGFGSIATISGRYWAMDRDLRWDRTAKAYNAMVKGIGPQAQNAVDAIKSYYSKAVTDEFIEPTIINKDGLVRSNDSVIFFNYRIDRPRQLTMAFVVPGFSKANLSLEFDPYATKYGGKHAEEVQKVLTTEPFDRGQPLTNLYFVTMTQYQRNLPVSEVAFPPEEVKDSLSAVISSKAIPQMHLSESEKQRFITYYFDGLREQRLAGEDVSIIASPKVPTYDQKPEMSVDKVCEEFKNILNKDLYRFIAVNIANPDMVAHSGKIGPTIKAIEATDKALGDMVESVLVCGGNVLVTADHGNAEELITYPPTSYFFTSQKGTVNTDHSNNPVPVIIINKALASNPKTIPEGKLADVAPTILSLMGIEIPPVMTGKNLLI